MVWFDGSQFGFFLKRVSDYPESDAQEKFRDYPITVNLFPVAVLMLNETTTSRVLYLRGIAGGKPVLWLCHPVQNLFSGEKETSDSQ
jgi:hypothetical protein